ncbi:MAG: DUF4115 domain-containing protein [Magnetococcales bacterium]|nr:DUF4115 domain-containing protein [Magnetococcales bacterium]
MVTVDQNGHLGVDSTIDHYMIKRVLGHGGFGVTYLAINIDDQTDVAIKEYFPSGLAVRNQDGSVRARMGFTDHFNKWKERFRKELMVLNQFSHKNIVKVLSFFESLGTTYIVMEFEEGKNLRTHLTQCPEMSETEVLNIVRQLLDSLDMLHDKKYLHRDIKPENIIIRPDGSPVLIDFGATRLVIDQVTHALTLVYTPAYTPLEQYAGDSKAQGPWSDIFSMGSVFFYMTTGVDPVPAPTRMAAINRGNIDPLPSIDNIINKKYPIYFLQAIEHAMQIKENDRPKTVSAWRNELLKENDTQMIAMPATINDEETRIKFGMLSFIDILREKLQQKKIMAIFLLIGVLSNFLYSYIDVMWYRLAVREAPLPASKPEPSIPATLREDTTPKTAPKLDQEVVLDKQAENYKKSSINRSAQAVDASGLTGVQNESIASSMPVKTPDTDQSKKILGKTPEKKRFPKKIKDRYPETVTSVADFEPEFPNAISLFSKELVWIQIVDKQGVIQKDMIMFPGYVFRVPEEGNFTAVIGNAGSVRIHVGNTVVPSVGESGELIEIKLNAKDLLTRNQENK